MIRVIYNKNILFAIIILLLILGITIFSINKNNSKNPIIKNDNCITDYDCVQNSCCHADSCINIKNKPNCSNTVCSMDCESILDCGQGKCVCFNNKCQVVGAN